MPVSNYMDKAGRVRWRIRVSVASKLNPKIRVHKKKGGFPTRKAAEGYENTLLEIVRREVYRLEINISSFGSLMDRWDDALHRGAGGTDKPISKAVGWDYIGTLNKWAGHLKKTPADKITSIDIKRIMNTMEGEGKSNGRKKTLITAINGMYKWGMENYLLSATFIIPTAGIKVSRLEQNKPEILNINQIRKLLECAQEYEHPWEPIWRGALLTGARSGELFALEFSDIDWEKRQLTIQRTYSKKIRKFKCTKGGSWRDVPINDDLLDLLKELRVKSCGSKFVFPRFRDWERGDSARVLRMFCEGIGIPSIKFHTLRACFATQLIRNAVAPGIVMKICGWTELKTMQRYIRLAGIEVDGATNSLQFMTTKEAMGKVVDIFGKGNG